MDARRATWVIVIAAVGLVLSGCATTRRIAMGPLPTTEPLITLVVTEDRGVIRDECAGVETPGSLLGCRVTRRVLLNGTTVQVMKIVRYTDALPSALAFEIDAHELCHAIASLQPIADPCHTGNDGVIQTSRGQFAVR
jgi:hypothetical protein